MPVFFYGREFPDDRHNIRTWWRYLKGASGTDMLRKDGLRLRDVDTGTLDADLANVDAVRPMMIPVPCAGQVWKAPDADEEIVSGIQMGPPLKVSMAGGAYQTWTAPPDDAVLVEGAGAPWAPSDWTAP